MIAKYLDLIIKNKILLSLVIGLLTVVIYFIDNRRNKKTLNYGEYIKILLIVSILTYCGFHLINVKNLQNETNYSKINIGEPDF